MDEKQKKITPDVEVPVTEDTYSSDTELASQTSSRPFWMRLLSEPLFVGRFVFPSLLILGLFLLLLIVGIFKSIEFFFPPVTVEVQRSGTIELTLRNKEKTAWFLLNPSGDTAEPSPWVDTGVDVPEGAEVSIHASGRITVALHHIIASALDSIEYPPLSPWVGPEGLDPLRYFPRRSDRAEHIQRAALRLHPGIFQGRLIGIISSNAPQVRPDTSTIINIGQARTVLPSEHRGGHLYLAINEIWLDPPTLDMLTSLEPSRRARWKAIADSNYANAWYDDNGGNFLVVVEIR